MPAREITMSIVSVAVCTHNPRREYLDRVLDGLRRQTLAQEHWEFLLIDNGSTRLLADEYDLSWHAAARHIQEPQLGLTAARLRAIHEFSGQILVFVDDDNVLDPQYLETVTRIHDAYPALGVFGAGNLEPEFETPPSREVEPYLPRLALRKVSRVLWSNNPQDSACCPYGAGLCVERATAQRFTAMIAELGAQAILGRQGQRLNSNEDDVFVWAAAREGLGFGVFPALKIQHLIPARRVSKRFILRLLEDSRFSECVLYYLLQGVKPRSIGLRLLAGVGRGATQGGFELRCRLAELKGEFRAGRLVKQRALRPLEHVIESVGVAR